MCGPAPGEACAAEAELALAVPVAVFAAWQVAYLLVTEVARKHRFDENAEPMTSLASAGSCATRGTRCTSSCGSLD
jgi:hypothetical protein